jgi:hypothetical protein
MHGHGLSFRRLERRCAGDTEGARASAGVPPPFALLWFFVSCLYFVSRGIFWVTGA